MKRHIEKTVNRLNRLRPSRGLLALALLGLIVAAAMHPGTAQAEVRRIHYSTLYSPRTVETVQGEVLALGKTLAGNGKDYCLNLTLKTAREKLLVILAPEKYAAQTGLPLAPQDKVQVTGSRLLQPGPATLIAAEIRTGAELVKLREADGRPLWAVGDNWHAR